MVPKKSYFKPLTEAQLKIIHEEFNIKEESLSEDVKHLIEWFEKQPHLPNITDEQLITNFLIGCKNSMERAKKQLEHFFVCRATMPEVFTDRERIITPVLKVAKKNITLLPHPVATFDGVRVSSLTIHKNAEVDYSGEVLLKAVQMIIEILLKTDTTTQMIAIFDLSNLTVPIMASCFPIMKKLVYIITKIVPLRYRKIYLVNSTPTTESFIQLFLTLLPKKISSRVEIWQKEPVKLATVISPEALPFCYGGTMGELETIIDEWLEYFAACENWLIADQNVKADLEKKPAGEDDQKYEIIGEYGFEGTFRKINLD